MKMNDLDKSNMYLAIYDFPNQMAQAMEIGSKISLTGNYTNVNGIVVAGMGGSAIGGDVARIAAAGELRVPMVVSRDYSLPGWVNENTLIICSSYSGNTEETLSAFDDAVHKKAMIIGVSTGGELTNRITKAGMDVVEIPGGLQPRAALAFSFVPMLYLLKGAGLTGGSFINSLSASIKELKNVRETWGAEGESNPAWTTAQGIYKTIPIIYSDSDLAEVAALRLKGQLNENAKMHAWSNRLPELNHNEIVGWEKNPELLKKLSVIWLSDAQGHKRNLKRREVTREIIGELSACELVLIADGDSPLERLIYLIHLGDWISYWCALAHCTDPTPVVKIDQLKQELDKSE